MTGKEKVVVGMSLDAFPGRVAAGAVFVGVKDVKENVGTYAATG